MPNRKEIELHRVQFDALGEFKRVVANLPVADVSPDMQPGEVVYVSGKGVTYEPVMPAKIEKITYDNLYCRILLTLCGPYDCFD